MSNIFPTRYSMLSADALKSTIAERYGLQLLRCKLRLHGVSDTYVLETADEKYILKVYRAAHRTLEEVQGEVELLQILKARGAKISFPIADKSGSFIQAFPVAEGVKHGVVYTYAKGAVSQVPDEEQLTIVGHEMAFNHNILSAIELQYTRGVYDLETTAGKPMEVLKPAFEEYYPEGYALLQKATEKVLAKMSSFDTATFSYGYCHYDYFPKNFFFDANNQLTLFDFDFAGKGLLMNDPASLHVFYYLLRSVGRADKEKADRDFSIFMNVYKSCRPVSEEEEKAVPALGYLLLLFYLSFQYETFEDWSNSFFGTKYLQERVGLMVDYAEEYS
ncbi:MAG: phosphotransferase [Chitinophagaceae bacterium]